MARCQTDYFDLLVYPRPPLISLYYSVHISFTNSRFAQTRRDNDFKKCRKKQQHESKTERIYYYAQSTDNVADIRMLVWVDSVLFKLSPRVCKGTVQI